MNCHELEYMTWVIQVDCWHNLPCHHPSPACTSHKRFCWSWMFRLCRSPGHSCRHWRRDRWWDTGSYRQQLWSIQWNLYKVTTELSGISRQVVFHNREDKHDFGKTLVAKWWDWCVFSKTFQVPLYITWEDDLLTLFIKYNDQNAKIKSSYHWPKYQFFQTAAEFDQQLGSHPGARSEKTP